MFLIHTAMHQAIVLTPCTTPTDQPTQPGEKYGFAGKMLYMHTGLIKNLKAAHANDNVCGYYLLFIIYYLLFIIYYYCTLILVLLLSNFALLPKSYLQSHFRTCTGFLHSPCLPTSLRFSYKMKISFFSGFRILLSEQINIGSSQHTNQRPSAIDMRKDRRLRYGQRR